MIFKDFCSEYKTIVIPVKTIFPDPRRKLFFIQKHLFVCTDCVRSPVRYAEVPNDARNNFP
jgi:hypothetical protein